MAADSPHDFRFFAEERGYLASHRREILSTYAGRYIAILRNSILDSDPDFSALAERVYQRFGYTRIFMPFVGERKVYHIASPRRAG